MVRQSISISFDTGTISEIDSIRGMVPRSRFIEGVVLEAIKNRRFSNDNTS